MDIEVRCEQCGNYLEPEKEYTDRTGLHLTVNPCSECIAEKKDLIDDLFLRIGNREKTIRERSARIADLEAANKRSDIWEGLL